ncbi:methyltransferase domain-containing protein [Streptomyces sp. NPDC007856]|uniref:methyltransferase domain-containing protein n=1 Tax=Streptomyces sp. NPDC007856 TaxID=3364781 RepID=UPI003695F928
MTRPTEQLPRSGAELAAVLDSMERRPAAVQLRRHSYDLLRLRPGAPVVDVGCGTGRAVAELAARGARAVGIDPAEPMLAIARRRWPDADLRKADAYALPLADGSMCGYRADKLFHELAEPERALGEARRVLSPGGRIVLLGQDWDTVVIDSDDPALTRTLVQARADRVTAPRSARRYRSLLLDAGFTDVAIEVRTAVFTDELGLTVPAGLVAGAGAPGESPVTPDRAEAWFAEQRTRAARDRLFVALPVFVASASAPDRP